MAKVEMKVPSPGESITEVEIAAWVVKDGDWVEKDQTIAEVDSDKATLELPAEESGIITLKAEEGETVEVGQVICLIDVDAKRPADAPIIESKKEEEEVKSEEKASEVVAEKVKTAAPDVPATPLAKNMMEQHGLDAKQIHASGNQGKIVKKDVLQALSGGIDASSIQAWGGSREKREEKMSSLRKKLSQRLVAVKNETAMLTTFNEVNMKPIMDIRTKYKGLFAEKHGVGLGFMSFFTKAVTEALHLFPAVNAQIDGNQIIFHDYADIGIAVSSPKGLMVPILRNAERMTLAEIESGIKDLAGKARNGKISIDEMTGGTFTITNGGVFGSMMSTPIINPPQSAILGMHNIVERPMAVNGKVEILPIMYVALSYDHRIIDGRESVGFLVKVKEMLENPERMIFGSKDPMEVLLGL
jgi:2-oxoglutarate dehydrogenase E2 component (dihydrolipoamide succinyltransferase)